MSTAAQQHCITLHKERSICHIVDIYLLAPLSWNAGLRSFSSSLYSVHCLEVLCWVKASWQLVSSLRRFSIIWGQVAKCDFGVVEFIIVSVISAEWHPVLNLLAGNDEAWCYTLSINPFCIHVNPLHVSWLTEMYFCTFGLRVPPQYTCFVTVSSSLQNCMSVRLKTPPSSFWVGQTTTGDSLSCSILCNVFHELCHSLSHTNRHLNLYLP